jgi:hypothetical protein
LQRREKGVLLSILGFDKHRKVSQCEKITLSVYSHWTLWSVWPDMRGEERSSLWAASPLTMEKLNWRGHPLLHQNKSMLAWSKCWTPLHKEFAGSLPMENITSLNCELLKQKRSWKIYESHKNKKSIRRTRTQECTQQKKHWMLCLKQIIIWPTFAINQKYEITPFKEVIKKTRWKQT